MKNLSIIILVLSSLSCQSDHGYDKKDRVKYFSEKNKSLVYETELIKGLTFPNWLKGVWRNTAESNTNNFIAYAFYDNKLTIRQGIHFQGTEKFIETYNNFQVAESSTDTTYFIELVKNKSTIELEFKLQSVEWQDEKVLTYSINENGKLKRDHLKSCQLILSKI